MARCARAGGSLRGTAVPILFLLGLAVSLGSGCRVAQVASSNLDELLDADHTFRYTAHVQTGAQFLVSQLIDPEWLSPDSILRSDQLEPIPDPSGEALQNLLSLREGGLSSSDPWLNAEQVRQYVRYAVHCPSALARERCFLELSDHALRLRLRKRPPKATPDVAANAAEISEALAGLVQALDAMVQRRGRVDETVRVDFTAACELLGSLDLDVDGGWRLLKVIARFGLVSRVAEEELEPLFKLSRQVQRDLVGLALAHGRTDPSARVRAAAWRANYVAYGPEFLAEGMLALTFNDVGEGGTRIKTPVFGLAAEWRSGEDEVFLEVFDIVREDGLPLPRTLTPGQRMRVRYRQLFLLVQIAHDFSAYGERTRAGAMHTLGLVSDAGFQSLRKEDWEAWWDGYREAEGARIDRVLKAEEGAAAGDGGNP